jgi:predicted RecA/RadA family phage recombinase
MTGLTPKTFKAQDANTIPVTLSGSVVAGQPAVINDLFGVYLNDGASGDVVSFLIRGAIDLAKASGTIAQGANLFFDAGNLRLTTDSDSGARPYAGNALLAAASGDEAVRCILNSVGNVTVTFPTLALALGAQDDGVIELTATLAPGEAKDLKVEVLKADMTAATDALAHIGDTGVLKSTDEKATILATTTAGGVLTVDITEASSTEATGFILVTPVGSDAAPQVIPYSFEAWT